MLNSVLLTLVLMTSLLLLLALAVRLLMASTGGPGASSLLRRSAPTSSAASAGLVEQWRLMGSREDVLARRLRMATATIDAAVVDALDRPDLGWRLNEAAGLIQQQLLACSRLPAPARPAVRREVEAMVVEFEAVCARLLLDAAQASSAVVHERLRGIEESVDVLRQAQADIAELGM